MPYRDLVETFAPRRENLLMILHTVQDADPHNHISAEAAGSIARYLKLTTAQVYGVIGYYSMLSSVPRGRHIIRLCLSPVCRMQGGFDLLAALEQQLEVEINGTTADGLFTLERCECLGNCHRAPSMMIDERLYHGVTPVSLQKILERLRREADGDG